MSQGISIRQGSHQVAQKFTKTTLPLRSARETSLPSTSFSLISGAGLPTTLPAALTLPCEETRVARSAYQVSPTRARTVTTIISIFFIAIPFAHQKFAYIEKRFRIVSLPESQVSLLKKTRAPIKSKRAPLNNSTACRYFRKFL